jgi:hypothetical protein
MSEAGNVIRRRGWPYSDLLRRAQSSPASSSGFWSPRDPGLRDSRRAPSGLGNRSSTGVLTPDVQLPLVPSHSEGASRILPATPKRIEFDPTHRKQKTQIRSERNRNALFQVFQRPASSFQPQEPYSIHQATRNDSRKPATATRHDANHFLLDTKSHVSEVSRRASSLQHRASRPWSRSSGIPASRKLDRSPDTRLPEPTRYTEQHETTVANSQLQQNTMQTIFLLDTKSHVFEERAKGR